MELGLGLWGTGVWIPGLWRYAPRSLPLPACVAGARPIVRSLNSDCWTHYVVDSALSTSVPVTIYVGTLRLTIVRGNGHGHVHGHGNGHAYGHGHGHGARGAETCQQRRHSPSFTTHRRKTQPRTEGGEATGTAETDTSKMSALSPGARHTPSSPEPDSDLASFTGKAFKF